MHVPVALATVAACGSIVTSVKSGWELSRMVRKKRDELAAEDIAGAVYRRMRKAYHIGLMNEAEYDQWYEKFLVAKVEKDLHSMRKIKAHLQILFDGAHTRRESRSTSSRRERRGGQDRYESQTVYTKRQNDVEWPQSAGSIEYRKTTSRREDDDGVHLARLQRRSSVSYPRSHSSSDTSSTKTYTRSQSVSRNESSPRRARRYRDDEDDEESDYYEKRETRTTRR